MKLSDFLKIKKDPSERVQIFIDGSNFYHGLKSECGNVKVDYLKFSELLAGGRKLIRLNFYTSTVDANHDSVAAVNQQRFLDAIRHVPYVSTKYRPLKYKGNVPFEKGVDILIATDMLTAALRNCYDTAILVSGDGDFVEVLEEIKRAGKQVENAIFISTRSDALINAADLFIELNKNDLKGCFKS